MLDLSPRRDDAHRACHRIILSIQTPAFLCSLHSNAPAIDGIENAMSSETMKFENGVRTYRIQFEIVAPPPVPPRKPGEARSYAPKPQFQVATIRVTEITEGVGDEAQKKSINFARGFDTLAQARTGASEYAKRIVREQMTPKLPAAS